MNITFEDFVTERNGKKVVFEWIGEGWDGDYNPNDPEDTPLLRFSCDQFVDGSWEGMEDASYCTQLSIHTPIAKLAKASSVILEAIQDVNYKKRLEELSWLCEDDLK